MSPRHTWIDSRADVLLAALKEFGLTVSREQAVTQVREHLAFVAGQLRVTEKTARNYITDEVVRAQAAAVARSLAEEAPGADPGQLDPTHTVPITLVGKTIAGLAIVATLIHHPEQPGNDIADRLNAEQVADLLVMWGASISRAGAPVAEVRVHSALIHRTIRELRNGVHRIDSGARPRDDGDPAELRTALDGNADDLAAEL